MKPFTLQDLQDIAREIIGDRDIVLSSGMAAQDVPGWDSLSHTLITFEITGRFEANVEAPELAALATFGDVVKLVNERIASPGAAAPRQ
jgi:acyl carrier protein